MIEHFLKIAFRNLVKNKSFTLINILGLSIGIMSFLFIFLWVQDELSYDNFHDKGDRIYRIGWQSSNPQTRTPHPMTYSMVTDFSEVENAVSITPVWGEGLTQPERTVKYGEKQFEESAIFAADTTFFDVFTFPMLQGDPKTALKDVGSIVISETAAKKIFGDKDPMNKMITINFGQDFLFRITGVIAGIPPNAHFHFNFLISYVTMKVAYSPDFFEWGDFGHYNYLLLSDGADPKDLEKKMIPWSKQYIDWSEEAWNALERGELKFALQALPGIHLHSQLRWELETNGNILYIYIFSAMGILVLVIACVNFMNLSIAKSSMRSKEVGVKKVVGANRSSIQTQFLMEAMLSAGISMILALVLFEVLAIPVGSLVNKHFIISYTNPMVPPVLLGFAIACGLLAGLYPAIFMSGFSPFYVLKGAKSNTSKNLGLRNSLVVFQFTVSIFLIIATLAVSRQVSYMRAQKLGFDSEQLLVIPIKDSTMLNNYKSAKAQLLDHHNISSISAVSNIPGRRFDQNPIQWLEGDEEIDASELKVDPDFLNTLQIDIDTGRFFSKDRPSDIENAFIINKTAAKLFKWDSPLQEDIIWHDDETTRRGKIIGVIDDFHFQSLHSSIEPLIIRFQPASFNYFMVRISNQDIPNTIEFIKEKYEALDPQHAFNYFFLDDDLAKLYKADEQMQEVVVYFTMLAIIISCIGLFGLSSFAAEQRTKEIGIRKVNGASVYSILIMLSSEFIKWIVISALIATPVTWYILNDWMQNFAFKAGIPWIYYPIAFLITLIVSWLTIGSQSIKAALKNPVDALRYE